jgi:hypothetical protein
MTWAEFEYITRPPKRPDTYHNSAWGEKTTLTGLSHLEGETVNIFPGGLSYRVTKKAVDPPLMYMSEGKIKAKEVSLE